MDLVNFLAAGDYCDGTLNMPAQLGGMIHTIYLAIKIVIPILLIIFGSIDLGKAITAQKEDEIKKAQSGFIKKLIIGVLVFLVLTIVQFVFQFATSGEDDQASNKTVWDCVSELLNGKA